MRLELNSDRLQVLTISDLTLTFKYQLFSQIWTVDVLYTPENIEDGYIFFSKGVNVAEDLLSAMSHKVPYSLSIISTIPDYVPSARDDFTNNRIIANLQEII